VQVRELQGKYGRNQLEARQRSWGWRLLWSQFESPLVYVLLTAVILTALLKDWTDSLVILIAVVVTGIFGYYQERKAEISLAALGRFLAPRAKVIREGRREVIPAVELVPGDVVILTIGTRIPADGELVDATDFAVNESILTGEVEAVRKNKGEMVSMGTLVACGIAKMQVTAIGMETQIGKIGKQVGQVVEEKTPLQKQLGRLVAVLSIGAVSISIVVLIAGIILGLPRTEMLTVSVAMGVAAVPEGLIIALTVILAVGMEGLMKRRAIVRKFATAEVLGAVSTLCVDKTGTITEGKMRVVGSEATDKELLIKAAILCNDMRDPLEIAMMEWAKNKLQVTSYKLQVEKEYPRLDEVPFSPKTKIIATLHPGLLLVSGAPEVVLSKCSAKQDSILQDKIKKQFDDYGNKGYRLVGFSYKKIQETRNPGRAGKIQTEDLEGDLVWLGIVVYEDPVREGVKEAIARCQEAGLKIKVVTGDYAATAQAVLKKVGLLAEGRFDKDLPAHLNEIIADGVITGDELEGISKEELKKIIKDIILFARTNPQQKLKIVEALQSNGEVVAMMGDGVNDAPALVKADVGIVVQDASDVAKETADMVLLDSRFHTVAAAIEAGRTIYDNIRKTVLYLISGSLVEVMVVASALLMRLPLPLTAAQLIWINLVEDIFPGVALAFESTEEGTMQSKPRKKHKGLFGYPINWLTLWITLSTNVVMIGFFVLLSKDVIMVTNKQSVMFAALALRSLFAVYLCRSWRKPIYRMKVLENRAVNGAFGVGVILMLLGIYLPPLRILLKTVPLRVIDWGWVLLVAMVSMVFIELIKQIFINRKRVVV